MRAALLLATLLAGCDALPVRKAHDGGHHRVPSTYLDARDTPGHQQHLLLSGEKQLFCRDCHFITDAGFTGEAIKACASCHPGQQEHHHPFAEGLDGGVPLTCFSCHAFRGVGEQKGVDPWGCGRCHLASKEHVPRVGVHQDKCEACHRPHGNPFTKAADCGQCHDLKLAHGKGEQAQPADTCMACHPHHSKAAVALGQCTQCHFAATMSKAGRVMPGALFEQGHPGCTTCHAAHQFTGEAARPCNSCHQALQVLAGDKHPQCGTCHQPHRDKAAAKTCEGCHDTVHPQHPQTAPGQTCLGCHPAHPTGALQPFKPDEGRGPLAVPCTQCHSQPPFAGPVVHAGGLSCASCHPSAHAGKPKRDGLCAGCHLTQHQKVQAVRGHASQQCEGCHAGLPHGASGAAKLCLDCHAAKAPPQPGHQKSGCNGCHDAHTGAPVKTCTDCHGAAAELPGLHQVAKHQKCQSCHSAHAPVNEPGPRTCRTCHGQLSKKSHPAPTQQCKSCHLFEGRP